MVTGLTLGEGDAAGEGLAAGFGLFFGGAAVSPAGEDDAAGDVVLAGEFVLVAGSQADTNAVARIVVSRSMIRLIRLVFELLIRFASLEQD